MTGSAPIPIDLLGSTSARFVDDAAARGLDRTTALQVYREAFRTGHLPSGPLGPRGIDAAAIVARTPMPVARREREGVTTKFTQTLAGPDRFETETVILPQESRAGRPRTTLCVSSQVGCAMGCTFCETAQMGLRRSLTAPEIVGQWWAARFDVGAEVDNVVFMGMGEPMDNLDAVIAAIEVLADDNGAAVPASRITVSTVGVATGIERLAVFARRPGFRRLRLAVSLNAPNDEIRSRIMPLNRAVPMARLMEAMRGWPAERDARVLIEYVLIPDVNDAPAHAEELARYLSDLPATVNVIPYNPRRDSPWPAPDDVDVDRFVDDLRCAGLFATRRRTMGRTVMAACGQLGNPALRRPRRSAPSRP